MWRGLPLPPWRHTPHSLTSPWVDFHLGVWFAASRKADTIRIAIIPARGGSKRIPRKNIKEFDGKPMLAYSIEAAKSSRCFDYVFVSSDDAEILQIARTHGAIPAVRSEDLSGDMVGTVEVLLDFLQGFRGAETVCCIYPCNPFLTGEKLQNGLAQHLATGADSTFPVLQYSYPPQRALKIQNGMAEMLQPEHYPTRSQDLEPIYHDAGQFYWLNVDALQAQQKLFMAKSTPLITSEMEAQDIDTVEDWHLAEVKYQLWRKNSQCSLLEPERKAHSAQSATPQPSKRLDLIL
jgi:N-acylneuraminate cytidylyltransferase